MADPAAAHPLDIAYLDFSVPTPSTLALTVAVHPYQAFELVRSGSATRFDLKKLQENAELISAYVEDHVTVQRDGQGCHWDVQPAYTPDTELESVADGITVSGALSCPGSERTLLVESTLFLEGFPNQTSILRLETPDGFADRSTLNHQTLRQTLDLSPVLPGGKWTLTASSTSSTASGSRRLGAAILEIATRLLDPGLGWLGFVGLLLAAAAVGMLHALGPGHGKSLLAAVLIGERATVGRAVALASVMAATHVADVFLMALIAGLISSVLPPTELLRILEMISAASLLGLGAWSLMRAIRRYRDVEQHPQQAAADDAAHARLHALGLAHTHASSTDLLQNASPPDHQPRLLGAQASPDPFSLIRSTGVELPATTYHPTEDQQAFRRSLWMGFVGSLAPCPTAWAMFMATLALGKLGAGILLLVSFSLGLYATVVAIGLLLVFSKTFALRRTPLRVTYFLPIISALMISVLGGWLLLRAL